MSSEPRKGQSTTEPQRRDADRPFRDQRWHFDKRLSLDTIVGILGVAIVIGGPVLVWGRAMENRVQTLEVVQDQRARMEEARDRDIREQRMALGLRLDKFDDQLTQMRIAIGQLGIQINSKGERR